MEEGDKLYPWFVFILFVFPYILRAFRAKKAREEKRREEAAFKLNPPASSTPPVMPTSAPPRGPAFQKWQRPVEKKPSLTKPKPASLKQPAFPGAQKKADVKRLMRELPTKKQLIVLGEIINRKEW